MYSFKRAGIFSTAMILFALLLSKNTLADRLLINEDRNSKTYWQTDKAKLLDSPKMLEMLRSIDSKNKSNEEKIPTPKEVAAQITQLILAEQSSPEGVHIETILTTLGAMAGFSCQMAIRDGFVADGKITLEQAFAEVKTKSGEIFYTGPFLNECLISNTEGQHSVWGFVGGAVQQLKKPLPNLKEIIMRVSSRIGYDDYGTPDLPEKNMPKKTSEELLWKYWNISRNTLIVNKQPHMFWPYIYGLSAQQLMVLGKDTIDPTLASKIVMEAAIAMSKIDPKRIHAYSLHK
ncbi:MAG: hypothetical protein COA93_11565 [Alphaproteobacteria bacterium]|nr:MAG: hypothetical protein COA93_11565 [Alphaproteobacteria bacterium]